VIYGGSVMVMPSLLPTFSDRPVMAIPGMAAPMGGTAMP
jgi:hypothetical protein